MGTNRLRVRDVLLSMLIAAICSGTALFACIQIEQVRLQMRRSFLVPSGVTATSVDVPFVPFVLLLAFVFIADLRRRWRSGAPDGASP